jgi:hypothetical protein
LYGRRTAEDGRFDWSWPAPQIHNLVRAVTKPFPGAFAELARDGHESVPPNWPTVLDLYQRLADQIGPALTVVAPDKIGDMDETLRRMRAHGGAVRSLVSCGTEVLIPIQCPPDLAPDLFSAQANT